MVPSNPRQGLCLRCLFSSTFPAVQLLLPPTAPLYSPSLQVLDNSSGKSVKLPSKLKMIQQIVSEHDCVVKFCSRRVVRLDMIKKRTRMSFFYNIGHYSWHSKGLSLSWRRQLSYRNRYIDLLHKSMDWFLLYDNSLRHERAKYPKQSEKLFSYLIYNGDNWSNMMIGEPRKSPLDQN